MPKVTVGDPAEIGKQQMELSTVAIEIDTGNSVLGFKAVGGERPVFVIQIQEFMQQEMSIVKSVLIFL